MCRNSIISWHLIILVLFLLHVWYTNCQSQLNSIFPIVYGNYYSYLDGSTKIKEYNYWSADNIYLIDMNVFSNNDILSAVTFNAFSESMNSNIQINTSSIVKTDYNTGRTLWAKELYYNTGLSYFLISQLFIVNDTAWVLLGGDDPNIYYPGLIVKLSSEGVVLDTFTIFDYDSIKNSSFFLSIQQFYVFSDFSIIAVAKCTYNAGEFGVSTNSVYDYCFFKINSSRDFQWSTSIDYSDYTEERISVLEFNNTFYVSVSALKFYYWLLSLDKVSGSIQKSAWTYTFRDPETKDYRRVEFLMISNQYIYTSWNLDIFGGYAQNGVFLFNLNTFELARCWLWN